jgi:virulence-associated protein VagC
VWSFGIASLLAVVLAGALAFPQDRVEITDSGGAQVVGE